MKTFSHLIFILLVPISAHLSAREGNEAISQVKFEHLRVNVADKAETAKWYVENVGLEIVPFNGNGVIYVADKDHNFMLELSSIPNIRSTYYDVHLDAMHIAFEGHKTIEAVAGKMLANNGVQEGTIYRNQIGDYVINVRDPNGFVSQLIHRVKPFYSKPVKSTIRFEHFAINTPDQKGSALWYVEFMDLRIPWSKDVESDKGNYRNYRVPYVGDASRSMSFELFGKKEIDMAFAKMNHQECHIAFTTDDPENTAKRMAFGGAKMVGSLQTDSNGDVIVDMVDPSGFPIRLIKRKNPVLLKAP